MNVRPSDIESYEAWIEKSGEIFDDDDWKQRSNKCEIRIEGRKVNPYEVCVGESSPHEAAALLFELDIEKIILLHDLEEDGIHFGPSTGCHGFELPRRLEYLDVDLRSVSLREWFRRQLSGSWGDWRRLARKMQWGEPMFPLELRDYYLKLLQSFQKPERTTHGILSWFTKPAMPEVKWSWIETTDVLDHSDVVTIVGRCIPLL